MAENSDKDFDEILGKPVFDDFTNEACRVRRNLLIVSFATIMIYWAKLTASRSRIGGFTVEGLDQYELSVILLIINLYLFLHFYAYVTKYWNQWRIRLTGRYLAYVTDMDGRWGSMASPHEQTEQHQSNFYSWLKTK